MLNRLTLLSCDFQQEIAEAATTAQRKFYKRFPNPADWTSKRVDDVVGAALQKVKSHFKGELKKLLPVADPIHTPQFLAEV